MTSCTFSDEFIEIQWPLRPAGSIDRVSVFVFVLFFFVDRTLCSHNASLGLGVNLGVGVYNSLF